MNTAEFLSFLRSLDIIVQREGDRLRINAPKTALSSEIRAEVARRKGELLEFLSDAVRVGSLPPLVSLPRDGNLSLSYAQQRLWFLDQLRPGSAGYVMPRAIRLRGRLDPEVLERCISEIVRRHESLRTVFGARDGVPYQIIHAPAAVAVPVTDVSGLPAAERERTALQAAMTNARTEFDLATGPLLRVQLLRLGPEEHVLLSAVHHIVFDGWSGGVFAREFAALYRAFQAGAPSPLAPLPIQYVDFAHWQRACLAAGERERHLAYWTAQLAGGVPPLELPRDRPRVGDPLKPGGHCTRPLSAGVTATLKRVSQQEGVSLFMTLLAAFEVLLHRLSGQDDFLVGTPVAGRSRAETEPLIGLFVNTVVIRASVSGGRSFRELLREVRERVLGAFAHQDMPFEELVSALDPQRDLTRTPLFQVFFNHLNFEGPTVDIAGLSLEPVGPPLLDSKFDLTLYVREQSAALDFLVVYNADLFDGPRMEDLLDQYMGLLEQIGAAPEHPVGTYTLVTAPMHGRLPDPTVAIIRQWEGSVVERLSLHAAAHASRVAVADPTERVTYGELDRLSGWVAGSLAAAGIEPGAVVAVYGHRSAALVVAVIGIWRTGAAVCILDPAYPAQRLRRMLEVSQATGMLEVAAAGSPPAPLEAAIQGQVAWRLTVPSAAEFRLRLDAVEPAAPTMAPVPDALAYVMFTSGTTGEPKCIRGTHRPLSHFLAWHVAEFGLTEADQFSLLSGLAHDPLLRDICTPLWLGATLRIPDSERFLEPGYLAEWLRAQRITVTHLAPALGGLIADPTVQAVWARGGLPDLRCAFFGGDVLPSPVVAAIQGLAPAVEVVSFYGATETPQAMAWRRIAADEAPPSEAGPGTGAPLIGRPVPGVQLLILTPAGRLAGVGEVGEICVRTPYLTEGYANDAPLTAQRFVVNPFTGDPQDRLYRTGDLGRYRPDGVVEFAGRIDRQVKVRGYRVELGEIETALAMQEGIKQCVVLAVPDTRPDDLRLIAYFAAASGSHPDAGELRERLGQWLPDAMIPVMFVRLDSLPLTPNGKIDRRALPEPSGGPVAPACGHVAPRNDLERLIARIWQDVLGLDRVGVHDSFFDLGGHSLAAVRLVARLRAALKCDLPLRSIFLEATIAGLCRHLRYDVVTQTYRFMEDVPRWKSLVPMKPEGSSPPLFLVAGAHADEDAFLRYLSHMIPNLGREQPVYGFRARGLDGHEEPHSSVEEMARDYVEELRTFQPSGPYLIAGECVGGVVALEMARQLIEQKEKVSLLALLDTERPTALRSLESRLRHVARVLRRYRSHLETLWRGGFRSWPHVVRALVRRKQAALAPATREEVALGRIRRTERQYPRLAFAYRPRRFPGRITLIVNEQRHAVDPDMGWNGVADQGLVTHVVPGNHVTRLTRHGKQVADRLLRCIEQARGAAPPPSGQVDEAVAEGTAERGGAVVGVPLAGD